MKKRLTSSPANPENMGMFEPRKDHDEISLKVIASTLLFGTIAICILLYWTLEEVKIMNAKLDETVEVKVKNYPLTVEIY